MEFKINFEMIKVLLFCVFISGVTSRGVPAADDNDKTLGGRSEKSKTDEFTNLTNCKGCEDNKRNLGSLPSREENRERNSGKLTSQRRQPNFIKPSLSFHRIKVRVNEKRRHEPKSFHKHKSKQHLTKTARNTPDEVAIDDAKVLLNKATTVKYESSYGLNHGSKDLSDYDNHKTSGNDGEQKQTSHQLSNSSTIKTEPEKDGKVTAANSEGKEQDFGSKKDTPIYKKNTLVLPVKSKEKEIDKSEDTKHTTNVKPHFEDRKGAKSDDKTSSDAKTKQRSKATDEKDHIDSESDDKLKDKQESRVNLSSEQKSEQHKDEEVYAKDDVNTKQKTPNSRVADRWSRNYLRQVPDVARLEWKLNPNVDVPARDILQSIRNMVLFVQRSLQQVGIDFDMVRNTTRYDYMMNVRDGLSTLAEENEIIYTVVLESSLLTKEIYRKAHEHRHSHLNIQSIVADYRQRYRDNIAMEIRREQNMAYFELEKAKQLVEDMKERLRVKQDLKDELIRVNHLVRDGLALTAMRDLERRAKQTVHILSNYRNVQSIADRANLYMHMGRDIHARTRQTKELLFESFDVIDRAKRIVMANQEKVHKYQMLIHSALRPSGVGDNIDRIVAWDRATSYARNLTDGAAFIMMKLKPLIQKAGKIMSDSTKYSIEKRLEMSASRLFDINKKLKMVYDQIIVEIDDERVLKQRCETIEGSGWIDDDEDGVGEVLIDCGPYKTESSGDEMEGSGDMDGLHVDFYLPDNNNVNKTDEVDSSDVDIDITEADKSVDEDDVIYIDENELIIEETSPGDVKPEVGEKIKKISTSTSPPETSQQPTTTQEIQQTACNWYGRCWNVSTKASLKTTTTTPKTTTPKTTTPKTTTPKTTTPKTTTPKTTTPTTTTPTTTTPRTSTPRTTTPKTTTPKTTTPKTTTPKTTTPTTSTPRTTTPKTTTLKTTTPRTTTPKTTTPKTTSLKTTTPKTTTPTTTTPTTTTPTTSTPRTTTPKTTTPKTTTPRTTTPKTTTTTPKITSTATITPKTTTITRKTTAITTTPKTTTSSTSKTPPSTTTKVVKQTECFWFICREVTVPTTTSPKTTPKPPTEKVTAEEVVAWFGFLEDEPHDDDIDVDVGENLLVVDNLLNNLIRKQLSNYSIESKELMDLAEEAEHKQTEISLTWVKVKDRFQKFENASRKAAAFVGKWRVEKNLFDAIHEEVEAANHSVTLKTDVVSTQCEAAVSKAQMKLKSMEAHLETQREKNENAADPVEFKNAKDKVTMATENLDEIGRLKKLHPNPCSVFEQADSAIKMNITELRKKIAKAKLLASSLKLAISVQKDSPVVYKIPQQHSERDPLRNSISVMLHHTGSDGHVITLHAKDEETVSMEMSDNKLQVIQYIDGDKEVLNVANSHNITDQQYLLEIERYGTVYNFTMTTEDGVRFTMGTKSLFDTPIAYTTEYLPTSVQIGGSDTLSTCFLGLQVNGHYIDWLKKKSKDHVLPIACESQSRWLKFDSHLLFEGSGFATYDFARRTIKSFSISFNPKSPGTIFLVNNKRHSILIDTYIDGNNTLTVYIKYKTFISQLVTMVTYGMDHNVKFTFKSRGIRKVDTTLNGKSDVFKAVDENKRSMIAPSIENDKLYIGGLPEQNSSFVGCVKATSINDDHILFETFEEAQDVKFGTCQTKNCVQFHDGSNHIEVTSLSGVRVIYLVVEKGSLGPVLQFSKNKKKFNLTVTVHPDSVSIEETVKEDSDEIYIDEDAQNLVISIQEDAEDESLTVTVNDEYEEVSYSSRSFWSVGGKEDDDNIIYTYDINIGGSTNDEKLFTGTISDVIIDGSPFNMLPYMEHNHLAGCQTEPTPKKTKTAKVYPEMICE